jgi:hypothetical protein
MSAKRKPATRKAVLERIRKELVDQFDVGLAVVSWEEGGETFHMDFKFGNEYAVEKLAERTSDILFPMEDDEEEEEEEAS